MAEPESNPRLEKISEALRGLLVHGEEFYVSFSEQDGVEIFESDDLKFLKFRQDHPRLYGRLLSLNEQLEGGCGVTFFGILFAVLVCVTLHLGLLDGWIGPFADNLKNWWIYILMVAGVFGVAHRIQETQRRRVYWEGRDDLLALLAVENLDRDLLLSLVSDDDNLENIVRQLKLDRTIPVDHPENGKEKGRPYR